jgi:ribosomal protein L11 methyltransferase
MSEQVWHSLSLEVPLTAAEAVEFALNEVDALGTEVIDFPKQAREIVTVTGYFDSLPAPAELQDALEYAFQVYSVDDRRLISTTTSQIENTDWLAEWKRYWKPSTIGNFVIAAPWHEVDDHGSVVIRIEPNMAFGTGTHETTQLCLAAIERYLHSDNSFLDVGTGTGILAIAARKLSMSDAAYLGIDNDPDSIKIAVENADLNDVAGIDFKIATLSAETPHFDFVCANLTLDVILPILSQLLDKTGRILVLSGILAEQEDEIVAALKKNGIETTEISRAGEWIAIVIQKH